jgi:crotonobetainyl-CoA:carnitine CoA-transferase CaiB-like acyl-CoA transferase
MICASRPRGIGQSTRWSVGKIAATKLEKWTADEILARLQANDVPSVPVVSRFELLHDPQVPENQILDEYENNDFGKVCQPRPAALYDKTPSSIRKLAPMLGTDNDSILSELAYGVKTIERLKLRRIVHRHQGVVTGVAAERLAIAISGPVRDRCLSGDSRLVRSTKNRSN